MSGLQAILGAANTADFFGGSSTPLASASGVAPMTAEKSAENQLILLRKSLASAQAQRSAVSITKSIQLQIDAILKKYPNIAAREKAAAAAQAAQQGTLKAQYSTLRTSEALSAKATQDLLRATSPIYAANEKKLATASVDLGLIPMGLKVLATGAGIAATGGALAAGLTAAGGITLAGAAAAGGKLVSSLATPGLASNPQAAIKQVTVAADKLIAAAEKGGEIAAKAKEVYDATKALASSGSADAKAALNVMVSVQADRLAKAVPHGVAQTLTAKGEAALVQFAGASKLAVATPAPAPSSAELPSVVAGLLILDSGRIDFASERWRSTVASAAGARAGLVVDNSGRIEFADWWQPV
jgi:hypothetical protein